MKLHNLCQIYLSGLVLAYKYVRNFSFYLRKIVSFTLTENKNNLIVNEKFKKSLNLARTCNCCENYTTPVISKTKIINYLK